MKHAPATQVEVTLDFTPPEVHCAIRDDAQDFDLAQLPAEPGLTGGGYGNDAGVVPGK